MEKRGRCDEVSGGEQGRKVEKAGINYRPSTQVIGIRLLKVRGVGGTSNWNVSGGVYLPVDALVYVQGRVLLRLTSVPWRFGGVWFPVCAWYGCRVPGKGGCIS